METMQRRLDASYSPDMSFDEQRPFVADTRYPLHSSLPHSPAVEDYKSLNGLARADPKERRSSGSGIARKTTNNISNSPITPEVANVPPTSYRPPVTDTIENRSANIYTGSFAQRAAILTGKTLPPDPSSVRLEPLSPSPAVKRERRTSLNRPIGGVYSEIQQHRRESYPASGRSPASPLRSSIPPTLHEPPKKKSHSGQRGSPNSYQKDQQAPKPTANQTEDRNASAASLKEPKDAWASNRSPLQKLEAKMTDRLKEEKRARVEEAEKRLRESKSGAQKQITASLASEHLKTPAKRLTGGSVDERRLRSGHNKPTGEDVRKSLPREMRNAPLQSKSVTSREQNTDRGVRFQDTDNTDESEVDYDLREEDVGLTRTSIRSDAAWGTSQANQIGSSRDSSSRNVPREQQNLNSSRALSSHANNLAASFGGQEDPIPAQPMANSRQIPKHVVPPQTAAGIHARQKVDFGGDSRQSREVPKKHNHHLSTILHGGQEHSDDLHRSIESKPRHLDEWKRAGVARLTTEDFKEETIDDSPWWENSGSKNRRRSGRGSVEADDIYPDGNGEYTHSLKTDKVMPGPCTRPYVSTSRSQKDSGRLLYHLRSDLLSFLTHKPTGKLASLDSVYSYSCPSLANHNPSHVDHICEPYLSKELTQSMRSVRIRPVPASAHFQPPLYLKSGPLLRYTGMKRDKLQSNGPKISQILERETWRGSVMIVTTDAASDYQPAPTLRLFPEPMEKLPPPEQQKLEGENTDDLPVHYMDPVAGLPKLSRTGKTVYVKPVDDLEHGKDLSKFEANDDGLFEDFRSAAVPTAYGTPEYRHGQNGPSPRTPRQKSKQRRGHRVRGVRLHAERGVTFWRFNLEIELQAQESRIAYTINNGPAVGFWVPGKGQTMNVMFHSCNGFSLSVNPDDFSGPDPLWRDVINSHQTRPFHVMIGGGDQIYNDAVMKQSPLFGDWLEMKNLHHKHQAEFTPALLEELETFYLERYSMWFSQGLFGMANAQIPMVNMWDDHDIIDGFGSYPHHFMSTPVFCGLGAVAFKYYMLFQHQSVPDETSTDEPSWLLGAAPGPYINEHSRSVFLSFGKHVAFLGLDCRTERMRDEILSEASYQIIFDRCRREIIKGETKHLIVLLGVPIAYPRLVWLENVITSRALDPIKAMGRMGMLGGFLNKFDGGVEILDDLDDHWTAKNHKQERNWFVQGLQELAAEKSIRITILGGDVHLAAIGQFFSNPKLKIPKDQDHRYMPNIISSAIVNTPPPEMMSDILNKRNKTHHLDSETDENMIPMFSHDVDGKLRNNKRLLPRRNWCSIREYHPGATPAPTPPPSEPETLTDVTPPPSRLQRTLSLTRADIKPGSLVRRLSGRAPPTSYIPSQPSESRSPSPPTEDYFLHHHSINRSSTVPSDGKNSQRHSSAPLPRPGNFLRRPTNRSEKAARKGNSDNTSGLVSLENGLDVVLNCEVDQRNPSGATIPYRLLVPALFYEGEGDENTAKYRRPNLLERFNSLRTRRTSKVDNSHEYSSQDGEIVVSSDMDEEEPEREEPIRPRRWSFGLEKRRRYRDQTPPQQRASQDLRPSSQRNPSDEAQKLGAFQDRSQAQQQTQSQRKFEDRHQQIGKLPHELGEQSQLPPPRLAKRFEYFEDDDYDSESPPRERMDSVDYHANLDIGQNGQNDLPSRRQSKVDRMLGVGGEVGQNPGIDHDDTQYNNDSGQDHGEAQPLSQRLATAYSGIEAYSEDKKGWRQSLKFF